MNTRIFLAAIVLLTVFSACKRDEKEIVTQKIQYDVNIKSPDPSYDWWIQNLPGPQRENLVDMILDGVLSGKFQAYDYFNDPITPYDVSKILSDTSALTLKSKEPPYEYYDTLVVYQITRDDILRVRFLEEWRIDPATLQFDKKILGIAPVARRTDDAGNERWQPLFWVYVDDDFIKDLKK